MTEEPRRIYQLDGINGGILNIAERPDDPFVLFVICIDGAEAQIKLSKADFEKITDLRYRVRFGETHAETPALRAVV